MKTTNSLPKYWIVQCNTFDPNWRKVIDYLHNVHGEIWGGDNNGAYYGYDGGLSCWKGTNTYSTISEFKNSPVVLTIEEFVEMTEGFVLPKKWCIKRDKENDKIVTDFINNYSESNHCYLDYNPKNPYLHYTKGVSSNYKPWNNYTEITFEQFKKHVLKTEETMRTITHTQAQQIIDIACREWKDRLFELWGKDIVMKKSIGISGTYYQAMRKACTHEQNQLFDEIFGKDKPSFKIGDWIMFEGSFGNAGPYQIKSFTNSGGALDQDGEFRDIQSQYRLATEDELKPKFKVGDWIVPLKPLKTYQGHGRGNRAYEIYDVDLRGVRTYNEVGEKDGNGFILFDEIRPATEEEIQKAKYIPEGTPCLVRDGDEEPWRLAYSNGDGKFRWYEGQENGHTWKQVQVLDMKNLPKY